MLRFKARGEGNFDRPMYEFDGTVADLYAGDEGIGQVHGRLTVRGNVLTIDQLDAVSNRLQVTGSGRIALNDRSDATLFFRLFETSLDPYLKFFAPELSPYTRAIVGGTVDIQAARWPCRPSSTSTRASRTEDARLTLFDYQLRNEGEVRLAFDATRSGSAGCARGTGHAARCRRHRSTPAGARRTSRRSGSPTSRSCRPSIRS